HASRRSRLFFFFQAEDGIRDLTVTGVQTCALPISPCPTTRGTLRSRGAPRDRSVPLVVGHGAQRSGRLRERRRLGGSVPRALPRSEERRVGKECRGRRPPRA